MPFLAAALCLALVPSGAPAGFITAPVYPAGNGAFSVAAGDFNGDGRLDLAVSYDSGLSILLGNGDGTFQPAITYPLDLPPSPVTLGDFNGDGILDAVVLNNSGFSLLLGNGDGTFQAAQKVAAGANPSALALGDFNGDGFLDIALANGFVVQIVLGNGDGTFQQPISSPSVILSWSIAVGDVNGDGNLDLVVGDHYNYNNGIGILLGNSDGTFQAGRVLSGEGETLMIADFNRDGKLDIAGAHPIDGDTPGTLSILLGNGDGTFQPPTKYHFPSGVSDFALGDFNGDGIVDIATGWGAVLLGRGDGTFQNATQSYVSGDDTAGLAVGDFNGDGKLDLAVGVFTGVAILLGNGDDTFQHAPVCYGTGSNPKSVGVADFNGDGNLDMAVANASSNTVSVLLGKGDGGFQLAQNFPVEAGPVAVAVGDVNGDGSPDLVVANQDASSLSVLLGDFNGDGYLDLAVAHPGVYPSQKATVNIWLGNGDGTFRLGATFPAGFGPNSLVVADLNGDGKLDLVSTNFYADSGRYGRGVRESALLVFLGNGDGTFQDPQTYEDFDDSPAMTVAIADFNKDGIPDLALSVGYILIYLGNGDGTFQSPLNYHLPGPADYIVGGGPGLAVGDFNGDGYPDLAACTSGIAVVTPGTVTVTLNDATWGP